MTVDFQRRPVREEFVGEAIGKQETLAPRMQQVYFLAVPVGFRTACAERQHAHMNQRREALGDGVWIQPLRFPRAHWRVIDQNVGFFELALQHSLTFRREWVARRVVGRSSRGRRR